MMPNLDPRALKSMMDKMGIKSTEIPASRVTIECTDKQIIINNPQIMEINAQGNVSYQISGDISEGAIEEPKIEITEDDIKTVMDQAGSDYETSKAALDTANGDIAEAIINIKNRE